MPDILHFVGIKSTPDKVYHALTTLPGLNGWWTDNTHGETDAGGVIVFRFGEKSYIDAKVRKLERDKHVVWEIVDGPGEWIGTTLNFELTPKSGGTGVAFAHRNWKAESESMHHCSTKWATFLLSLQKFVETGKGAAFPNDVKISFDGD